MRWHDSWRRGAAFVLAAAGAALAGPGSNSADSIIANSIGMRLAPVPAGEFAMGSPATEPGRHPDEMKHPVNLTKGFFIGVTEVTQREWDGGDGRVQSEPGQGRRSAGDGSEMGGSGAFLRQALGEGGAALSAADGGGVGTCVPGWGRRGLSPGAKPTTWRGTRKQRRRAASGGCNGSRMPGGCTTCTATRWNGARTGMQERLGREPVTDPAGPAEGEARVARGRFLPPSDPRRRGRRRGIRSRPRTSCSIWDCGS